MTSSSRTLRQAFVACVLFVSLTSGLRAQTSTLVPGPWPWTTSCYGPPSHDAFQLLYNWTAGPFCLVPNAALRLTIGTTWTDPLFAQLGVADTFHMFLPADSEWYSAIAPKNATVLRSSWGDLVLSATTSLPTPTHAGPVPNASIHFGTTPNDSTASAERPNDRERATMWYDGKVAMGTQGTLPSSIFGDSLHPGEYDLLHLHVPCLPMTYTVDPASGYASNQLMTLKLSYGGITNPYIRFAELGFDRNHQLASFSSNDDLVLSTNSDQNVGPTGSGHGDIIVSNRHIGKAIRFATTYDTGETPLAIIDAEHLTIASNGNVGIDLPKDPVTGLCTPPGQVQIGGGSVAPAGYSSPIPGLGIYGGNALEGTRLPNGDTAPVNWRGISFNQLGNPLTGYHSRYAPMSSCGIGFSDQSGGLLDFTCLPYSSTRGLSDFSKAMTMEIQGSQGLQTWFLDTTSNPYHHLLDIFLPGTPSGIRNTNGLTYIHTPLCISSDHPGDAYINFDSLANVYPDIGDGKTWMLAVNGPALFKEVFVLDSDWADYAFLPGYGPMPLTEVEQFTQTQHHLPDIPSQQAMHGAVDVAKTDEAITHQIEDEMLYIEQLKKQNDALAKDVEELKSEVQELKNGKEK